MTASQAPVSVVVVNWNRRELLHACLRSLARQTRPAEHVVVVDNGSTDGSLEGIEELGLAGLEIIRNTDNRGFCEANNQGIAATRTPLVALLNNDAEAEPGWIEALVSAVGDDADLGMAASKILVHGRPGQIDKVGHLIYPDGQNRGRGTGETDNGQYDRPEQVAWPDGCAALYRRKLLDATGGFDEEFFAYADDADLGLRAQIAGWRCVYAPGAVVHHRVGSTLGEYSPKRLFLIERNRIWLAAKCFPIPWLMASPFYYVARVAYSIWAGARGEGELSNAAARIPRWRLIQSILAAHLSAWRGLPRMLRKRRALNEIRKLTPREVGSLLRRFAIPLRDLVSRTRQDPQR